MTSALCAVFIFTTVYVDALNGTLARILALAGIPGILAHASVLVR